jgi:hypothetical protein
MPNPDDRKGPPLGVVKVRDRRFDRLVEIYAPRQKTPAYFEFALMPDLDKQAQRNETLFRNLEKFDVLCHLIRTFEDDTVFHVEGTLDPLRDIRFFNEELQLHDLLFIEKRLERLEKEQKKKDAQKAIAETELLGRLKVHLDRGMPLRTFTLTEGEERILSGYPLLTRKTMIIILNVGEDELKDPDRISRLKASFPEQEFEWISVSAKIEEELSHLDPEERQAFLRDLHLDQPALDRLTLLCYNTLGLISFFTVGPDEVRAWTNRHGTLAPQAGRVIHSDIERGFIRAEVMKYNDLIQLGGEQKVKESGRLLLRGKDYQVEDGDIINFLFNV